VAVPGRQLSDTDAVADAHLLYAVTDADRVAHTKLYSHDGYIVPSDSKDNGAG
jgi:hypothetical protein